MVDYLPSTVVLKMLDIIIMEADQENSLKQKETRRKHESISCIGAKGQH